MKHFVFCAGASITANQKSIQAAKFAKNTLELEWMLDYDCIGETHSKFGIIENANVEIYLESANAETLIDDCMAFAYRYMEMQKLVKVTP